jgi:hypothetical protein
MKLAETRGELTRRRFIGLAVSAAGAVLAGGCSSIQELQEDDGPRTMNQTIPEEFQHDNGPVSSGASQSPWQNMQDSNGPVPKTSSMTVPATGTDEGYAPPASFTVAHDAPVTRAPMSNGVIPRAAWTKAGPAKPMVPMNGVELVTFHHDGDPGGFYKDGYTETALYLERIRAYHVKEKFEDIGYHYAIDRAGRVWQLRPVQYRGEHVRNGYDTRHQLHRWNDHNVGVVVLGNFMLQEPTAAQKAKICVLGAKLRRQYDLSIAQVKVHQELVTTECPGIHMRPYMDEVRKQEMI